MLVVPIPPQVLSICANCGQVVGVEQRTLQKISLPLKTEEPLRLGRGGRHSWVWGIQTEGAQLLQINPTSSKIQATYASPNHWQINGLAGLGGVLVISPWEPNPPGVSKALVGLDPDTGKVLWEHYTSGFMLTAPAADETLVCAVDSNGILIAVSPRDGKAIWNSFPELGDYPHRGIPPVLSREYILAVEAERRGAAMVAVDRLTGEIAWEFRPPENAKVDFAPAVWNDAAFVLAGEWLYRVSLKDGTWQRLSCAQRRSSQGWYFAPPVVDEEHVYLLEAGFVNGQPGYMLHAYDESTKQPLWRMNLKRRPYQQPVLQGKHLYFVDRDGELFYLNKNDGLVIWHKTLSAEPADAPIVLDEVVLALTKDAALYIVTFSTPTVDLSQPPTFYEKRSEWSLAAGAYLANGQPFEAGLALLKVNDYRQANLAFHLAEDVEPKIHDLIVTLLQNKNDTQAAELCEGWGMILLGRLGEGARGNAELAGWFEQAAENFMLANQTLEATNCRERAAQVMEIPRIKLEVIADNETRWVVNEPLLLQVRLTNVGYGPARRISVKVGGNIRRPYPSQSFTDVSVDHVEMWNNVRITPSSSGAGLLEFTLDYESYRTGQLTETKFTHPIDVERNEAASIPLTPQESAPFHMEKLISPGATQDEMEVLDSPEPVIGESAQPMQTTESVSRSLHVFLCHSSDDKPAVRELYQKLSAEGWIDVWLDEEKLLPGQNWEYEIEKALDNSDAVIVSLSSGSVSKEGYVQKELRFVLEIALEKPEGTIFILPLRLDDCERPRRLRHIQGIDYFPSERRDRAYARLRSSLVLRAQSLGITATQPK